MKYILKQVILLLPYPMGLIKELMIDYVFFGPWTWLFSILESIVPADKNMIIFGSNHGNHASDNSLALFRHMVGSESKLNPIWITKNRAVYEKMKLEFPGRIVMSLSVGGFISYLRATQVVISHSYLDMCLMPYSRRKVINYLWHGVPIRKIGMMFEDGDSPNKEGITKHWRRWNKRLDYFFASSDYEAEIMKNAFPKTDFEINVTGYPRNDLLVRSIAEKTNEKNHGRFTILYAPTYRISSDGSKNDQIPLMHPDLSQEEMDLFLDENHSKLIIRPHPLSTANQFLSENIDYVTVDKEPDISELFLKADLFVTDYSSAYFDWLILGKPVLFSVYDYQDYSKDMGFINRLEDISVGDVVYSKNKLLKSLQFLIKKDSTISNDRYDISSRLGIRHDLACPEIMKIIESNIA